MKRILLGIVLILTAATTYAATTLQSVNVYLGALNGTGTLLGYGGSAGETAFDSVIGIVPPTTPVITATPGDTTNTITLTGGDDGALTNILYWDTTSRASYDLYANSISNATLVAASFPGTPYVHTGRTNGTPYYYRLCGTDLAGQTCSSEVNGTPTAGGGLATITYQTSTVLAYGGNTNSTPGVPTGSQAGDLIFQMLYIESDMSVTQPTGCSTPIRINLTDDIYNMYICYTQATDGSPSTVWTHAFAASEAHAVRFSGVVTSGTVWDATESVQATGQNSPITLTGITTGTNTAGLVMAICNGSGTGNYSAWSSPLTERTDSIACGIASGNQATAGASGDKSVTSTQYMLFGGLFALKPASL